MTDRRRTIGLAAALGGAALAGCAPSPPAPAPPAPPPEIGLERGPLQPPYLHVVAAGETLSDIAHLYRLDTHDLARANGIGDVDHIAAGRRLALRWSDPPTVGAPPARAAEARAIAGRAPGAGAEPLRVIVTPRETEAAKGEGTPAADAADRARDTAAPAEHAAADDGGRPSAPAARAAAEQRAGGSDLAAEHAAAEEAGQPAGVGPAASADD